MNWFTSLFDYGIDEDLKDFRQDDENDSKIVPNLITDVFVSKTLNYVQLMKDLLKDEEKQQIVLLKKRFEDFVEKEELEDLEKITREF